MTFFTDAGFKTFPDLAAAMAFAASQVDHYVFNCPESGEFVSVPSDFARDLIAAGSLPVC